MLEKVTEGCLCESNVTLNVVPRILGPYGISSRKDLRCDCCLGCHVLQVERAEKSI